MTTELTLAVLPLRPLARLAGSFDNPKCATCGDSSVPHDAAKAAGWCDVSLPRVVGTFRGFRHYDDVCDFCIASMIARGEAMVMTHAEFSTGEWKLEDHPELCRRSP